MFKTLFDENIEVLDCQVTKITNVSPGLCEEAY